MSRVIKFRGWNKHSHIMVDKIRIFTPYDGYQLNDAFSDEMIVMPLQFTGLTDKNGKEIYEGDIVRSFDNINRVSDPHLSVSEPTYKTTSVEYYNGAFRLTCSEFKHGCGIVNNYAGAMAKDLEVIGNIYETPELLK